MLHSVGKVTSISVAAVSLFWGWAAAAQTASYSVNEFVLGGKVPFDSRQYREYRCGPSEQFDGFTWCQRNRHSGQRRGSFNVTQSLLHSRDGRIAYLNRQQDPVAFDGDVEEDMRTFSRRFGSQPRITRLSRRSGAPEGVLAMWGQVSIEPLDSDSVKILADGQSPKKGFLVDFVGNLVRSARDGLPIYRITGGPGFIWVASYDQSGRGTLRVTAVDTSMLAPPVVAAATPPSLAGDTQPTAPTAESEPTASPVEPPVQVTAVEPVPSEARSGQPEINVAANDAPAQATNERPPASAAPLLNGEARSQPIGVDPEPDRLKSATRFAYIVVGLSIALLVAALLAFWRRSRARAPVGRMAAATGGNLLPASTPTVGNASPRLQESTSLRSDIFRAGGTALDAQAAVTPADENVTATAPSGNLEHENATPLAPATADEHVASIVPSLPERADLGEIRQQPSEDGVSRLIELAKLRESGLLTEAEFNQLKTSIIATVTSDSKPTAEQPPQSE